MTNSISTEPKRLSVRRVALAYGIPQRAVSRAIATGKLPAVQIETETGRVRSYVSHEDAAYWFASLCSEESLAQKSAF